MSDTAVRRMTTEEIALLREIVRWRRNHDVQRRAWSSLHWVNGRTGQAVHFEKHIYADGSGEFGTCPDYHNNDKITWHRVTSFGQAVDVLVALGYLPQRFSRTYLAGWHASRVWYDDGVVQGDAEFKRLFGDPENISFPVGGDA